MREGISLEVMVEGRGGVVNAKGNRGREIHEVVH